MIPLEKRKILADRLNEYKQNKLSQGSQGHIPNMKS